MSPLRAAALLLSLGSGRGASGEHYWPYSSGNANRSGATPIVAPGIDKKPAWIFNEELDVLRAGPLIDADLNVYFVTGPGYVRKFDQDGNLLWMHDHQLGIHVAGSLMDGAVFFIDNAASVFALDMATGDQLWSTKASNVGLNTDTAATLAYNGTVFVSARLDSEPFQNNRKILAVDSRNGEAKWSFAPDSAVFNFMASAPGDGSVIFQDISGTVYKLSLNDGQLIWKSEFHPPDRNKVFTTGHTAVGPNGLVYAAHNTKKPGGPGVIRAVRLADGVQVWEHLLGELEGNRAPAVGRIHGGALAVVAGVGVNPGFPVVMRGLGWFVEGIFGFLPEWLSVWVRVMQHNLALRWHGRPQWLFKAPVHYRGAVVALGADDGKVLWQFEPPVWTHPACAGDSERLTARVQAKIAGRRIEDICLPDSWASPTIDGAGTVLAGFMDGVIYQLRDLNGDGVIEGRDEVVTYDTKDGFLGGMAIGPGLVAAVPCGGGMYVWRS